MKLGNRFPGSSHSGQRGCRICLVPCYANEPESSLQQSQVIALQIGSRVARIRTVVKCSVAVCSHLFLISYGGLDNPPTTFCLHGFYLSVSCGFSYIGLLSL